MSETPIPTETTAAHVAAPADPPKRKRGRPRKVIPPIPQDLKTAIATADTYEALGALLKKVTYDLVDGKLSSGLARAIRELLQERRQSLKNESKERELNRVTGVAILLTPNEVAAIDEFRSRTAPKPLGPDESAAIKPGGT